MRNIELENLITTISPNDDMYLANKDDYFTVGQKALEIILNSIGDDVDKVKTVLDMPCGFGRVIRFLRAFWPHAKIVANDLNWDAVDFCHKTFNAIVSHSNTDIQGLQFPFKFDLIWVGSLFTHLDEVRCDNLLKILIENLNEEGTVVFTTHGRIAAYLVNIREPSFSLSEEQCKSLTDDFYKSGFGYVNYDDNYPYYGFSLIKPSYIINKIEKIQVVKILTVEERAWGYQDVVALKLMNMGFQ
jgi:SAM-dependent methyltransferase